MTRINIEIVSGDNVGEDDRDRARNAAEAVLDAAGIDPGVAFDEYKRQWLAFDDEAPMTGHALLWIAARKAAATALTEGWVKPDGAHCSISA